MTRSVTFDVIARDRASGTFRKVGAETTTLGSKLKTFAKSAGLLTLGYEAVRFGKASVSAFLATEQAQNKLQDAFARFPALADTNIAALQKLNTTLEKKTGADHNALASGQAVLAGFKLTGAEITQITPLLDDYAAKTGQDIPTAATALGRAFLGNTRALKTIGISFTATGNTAQDFATIVGLLQAKVGGFADREAKTAAGRLKILEAQFRLLEEQIGSALLPALTSLGNFLLHDVIPPLRDTAHFIKSNEGVIKPLAEAIGAGIVVWKAWILVTKAAAAANLFFAGTAATAATAAVAERTAIGAASAGSVIGNAFGGSIGGPVTRLSGAAKGGLVIGAGVAAFAGTTALLHHFFGDKFGRDHPDPEANLAPAFRKEVDALGGLNKATAYWAKLNLAASRTEKTATQTVQQHTAALAKQQTQALALIGSEDSLRSAVNDMANTVASGGTTALRGNTDAAIANRGALVSVVTQAQAYLKTLKDQGANADQLASVQLGLARSIHKNAVETYGNKAAVDQLLTSLGYMPSQIDAIVTALAAVHPAFTAAFGSSSLGDRGNLPGALKAPKFTPPTLNNKAARDAASAAAAAAAKDAADAAAAASKAIVDKAAAAAKAAFDKAQQQMRTDFQTIKQFYAAQRASLLSTFGAFNASAGTDLLGASAPAQSVVSQLRSNVAKMDAFVRLYKRLDNEGLAQGLLDQFAALGPDAIPQMQELLRSGKRGIRRADRLQRRLSFDAGTIAVRETQDKYTKLIHEDLQTLPRRQGAELAKRLRHLDVRLDVHALDTKNGKTIRGLV